MKRIIKHFLSSFYGKEKYQIFFNKLYYVSLKGMNYISAGNYKDNGEIFTLKKLKKYFSKNQLVVIFDIGANIGSFTQSLLNEFSDFKVHIHCFEPSKQSYSILKNNLIDKSEVTIINAGVSDVESRLTLYGSSKKSTLSSLYQREIKDKNMKFDISEEIDLTTIDQYCIKNKIGKIDFLKLDIEGHELNALQGAEKKISENNVQFIQFEYGGCNVDARIFFKDIFKYLNPRYNIFRILKDGLYPIKEYDTKLEIFQSSNYLAVNKNIDF